MQAFETKRSLELPPLTMNSQETEMVSVLVRFAMDGDRSAPEIGLAKAYVADSVLNKVVFTVAQSGLVCMRMCAADAWRHDKELYRELQVEMSKAVACLQTLRMRLVSQAS